ncbi:MAG: response regulator [bacterium]
MNEPIRVAIVSSDELFYQRAREVLESADRITVVGEAEDTQKATDLVRETHPDVILLEIGSRHASNLEILAQIQELFPRTRIIVFNEEDQEELVLEAFRKGALGHLVKGKAQPAEIVEAIRAVNRGEAILSPGLAGSILDEVIQEQRKSLKEPD